MTPKSLAGAVGLSALAFVVGVPPSAQGAPLSGSEILARTPGGEFRGYGTTRRAPLEDVIWRFRPNGTVSSISQIRRRYRSQSQFEEYTDFGTWRIEGNQLCVEFGGPHREFSGCYTVDGDMGDHVRIGGPVHMEGTLGR